jgi:uncharacterized protein (TIGR00725 family)
MKRKLIIGVVGAGNFDFDKANISAKSLKTLAYEIGIEIAKKNYWLLCGGLTGVMQAAARGAQEANGLTIGIIPKAIYKLKKDTKSPELPNKFIDIAIFTGLGGGVKNDNGFGRNAVIVNTCDGIIGLPGSNKENKGTRSEINFAIKNNVPVVLDEYWRSAKISNSITESLPLIQFFKTPREAIIKLKKAIAQRDCKNTTARSKTNG